MTENGKKLLFDKACVAIRRARAMITPLTSEACALLAERILDIDQHLNDVLMIGAATDDLKQACEMKGAINYSNWTNVLEEKLPFKDASFDLILSVLDLQETNDFLLSLRETRRCLKPNGIFLAVFVGENSLTDLKGAFLEAEQALRGGVSPHVIPMVSLLTASNLMVAAEFDLPLVDKERIELTYPNFKKALTGLRAMGTGNTQTLRFKGLTTPHFLNAVAKHYPSEAVSLTFDLIFLHGRKQETRPIIKL